MTSAYRREHEPFPLNDEYARLGSTARTAITAAVTTLAAAIAPGTVASEGETLAAKRALARYLIDSGKASAAGEV